MVAALHAPIFARQLNDSRVNVAAGVAFASPTSAGALSAANANRTQRIMTRLELQAWRSRVGLSQAGLAALLGVNEMTVSRWERGARQIPPFLHLALDSLEREHRTRRAVEAALDEAAEGMADPEIKAYVANAALAACQT